MAYIVTDGFDLYRELGDLALRGWGLLPATAGLVPGFYNAGQALRIANLSTAIFARRDFVSTATEIYVAFDVLLDQLPTIAARLVMLTETTSEHVNVMVNTNGTLAVRRSTTVLATSTATLVANTRYRIELRALVADTGGVAELRVDGSMVVTFTGDTRNVGATGAPNRLELYGMARSDNIGFTHFDNLTINTTAGAAPIGYPGILGKRPTPESPLGHGQEIPVHQPSGGGGGILPHLGRGFLAGPLGAPAQQLHHQGQPDHVPARFAKSAKHQARRIRLPPGPIFRGLFDQRGVVIREPHEPGARFTSVWRYHGKAQHAGKITLPRLGVVLALGAREGARLGECPEKAHRQAVIRPARQILQTIRLDCAHNAQPETRHDDRLRPARAVSRLVVPVPAFQPCQASCLMMDCGGRQRRLCASEDVGDGALADRQAEHFGHQP